MSAAIKTITDMVLISIHPFALRKVFLAIGVLLCLSALCFADPVLMAQHYAASVSDAAADAVNGNALTELKVDLPSRGQELLPSKDVMDQSFQQPEALFRSSEDSIWAAESV
jgi:hypothetical protein